MRQLWLAPLVLAFSALCACGGGAGTGDPGLGTGAAGGIAGKVTGAVTQIDDRTADLGGIQLELLETGEVATTSADGGFAFSSAAPRAFTLALRRGGGPVLAKPGDSAGDDSADDDEDSAGDDDDSADDHDDSADDDEDSTDDDDKTDDGEESSEDRVEILRVEDGERVHVSVRIRDGVFEQVDVSRSSRNEREAEVFMVRAATSDDEDATGKLEIEVRDDRQRFEVEVEHVTPGRDLVVFVLDPDGQETSLGVVTADALGNAEWEINTGDGGVLPFGVASVAALEGYDVQVRDASDGTVLLRAQVPEVPAALPPLDDTGNENAHDDDGDDDDGDDDDAHDDDGDDRAGHDDDDDDDDAARARGRSRLVAAIAALSGHVEVRSRPSDARERLEIEGEHLQAYVSVEFFLEDGAGSGSLRSLGVRSVDLEGEAELELDTSDGDLLPNGASKASQLEGLLVEVRDATTGTVLLTGSVPALAPES